MSLNKTRYIKKSSTLFSLRKIVLQLQIITVGLGNETYIGELEGLQNVNVVQKQKVRYWLHSGIASRLGFTRNPKEIQ
jgi:hypothetical protein